MTHLEKIIGQIKEMKKCEILGERDICIVCISRIIKKLRKNDRENKRRQLSKE